MPKIKDIELYNFRNFKNLKISFDNSLNILFGDNGCGKTNILESISLIAKGRGIRNSNIINLIKKQEDNFLIKNNLEIKDDNFNIEIFTEKKNNKFKKVIKINDDLSKDSLDFLNQSISYLIFLPEMERLFQASPSYRRNFLDRLIFSSRNDYNRLINKYKKSLIERNKIMQSHNIDDDWLNRIESEICLLGLQIYKLRNAQLNILNIELNKMKNFYKFQFDVKLEIKDDFANNEINFEDYLSNIKNSRVYDKQFGGTKIGPHKSDIISIVNNDFEASLLSTGQQKTIVLMILLAQCNYLVNDKKINPIFLFDEIGSHLDKYNRQILLEMINKFQIQFFLTGTDKNLFSFVSTKAEFYNITEL
ncbi:DNA replication and repair protein RecF [Pelagibacteraceae bacterium]|nr:DNA replication and repair protein RecF [Pelagibacteraceae bacterium]